MKSDKNVLIVGGGFGGVACAKRLAEIKPEGMKVRLVSELEHFEYHAALYRVVTGKSPMEICIPLADIFGEGEVEVVQDKIVKVDLAKKVARGKSGSVFGFDEMVLALGSETAYYDIPGLEKYAFGFKNIHQALRLKRHLHELMSSCRAEGKEEGNVHIVVVGGGASGTELAAELAVYIKKLAKMHGVEPSLVTLELVQSPSRLLPDLPEEMSKRIEERVRSLGVNVYLNQRLVKEDVEKVWMSDMQLKAKTVIWTAGVVANRLYEQIEGLQLDRRGRVEVDKYLRAKGNLGVYVVGDGAKTKWSGMAQTALGDGRLVAENLAAKFNKFSLQERVARKPIFAIPVGPGWAAVWWGEQKIYGRLGWWLRRLADLRFFGSILTPRKALRAFMSGMKVSETCGVCREMLKTEAEQSKVKLT